MKNLNHFNLIKDWYFCCCVDTSPKITSIYLSSLNVIDNQETTTKFKSIAYNQLLSINNPWLSLYALPQILQSFAKEYRYTIYEPSNNDLKNVREAYHQIAKALVHIDYLPYITVLIDDCFYLQAKKSTYSKVIDLANLLQVKKNSISHDHPYNDLTSFAAHTILVTVVNHLCEHKEHFAKKLTSMSNFQTAAGFFDAALHARYGRMAFGLVLEIAPIILDLPKEDLSRQVWSLSQSKAPEFEPDIMYWFGLMTFVISDSRSNETSLFEEYSFPNLLMSRIPKDFVADRLSEKYEYVQLVFLRFGAKTNEVKKNNWDRIFPFLLWQEQLIAIASHHFPEFTFNVLKSHLIPKSRIHRDMIPIFQLSSIYENKEGLRWKQQIHYHLASFHSLHTNREYKPNERRSLKNQKKDKSYCNVLVDEADQWRITSPWLSLKMSSVHAGHSNKYFAHNHTPLLIRLSGLCLSVIKLLQNNQLSKSSDVQDYGQYFRFLAHTKSVNSQFNKWTKINNEKDYTVFIENYRNSPRLNAIRLSFGMTGLIKTSERVLDLAACGYYSTINPQGLINDSRDRFNQADENEEGRNFDWFIYPEALLYWLLEALPGALKKNDETTFPDDNIDKHPEPFVPGSRNYFWTENIAMIQMALQIKKQKDPKNYVIKIVKDILEESEELQSKDVQGLKDYIISSINKKGGRAVEELIVKVVASAFKEISEHGEDKDNAFRFVSSVRQALHEIEQRDVRNLIDVTALLRLLKRDSYERQQSQIDSQILDQLYWTKEKKFLKEDTKKKYWEVRHRKLLLFENEVTIDVWGEEVQGSHLHRLIKGLEALDLIHKIDDSNSKKVTDCIYATIEAINEISEPKDLDRLVRLRMLAFMDHSAFSATLSSDLQRDWENLGNSIIHTLLEFGGTYEINGLFSKVFVFNEHDCLKSDQNLSRFHQLLVSYIFRYRNLPRKKELYPTDPKLILDQFQKSELVSNMLKRLTFAYWKSEKDGYGLQGSIDLKSLNIEFLEDRLEQNFIKSEILKEYSNRGKHHLSLVKQAVYNRSKRQYRVFSHNYNDLDLIQNIKISDTPFKTICRLLWLDNDHAYFDCGLGHPIKTNKSEDLSVGDEYILDILWDKDSSINKEKAGWVTRTNPVPLEKHFEEYDSKLFNSGHLGDKFNFELFVVDKNRKLEESEILHLKSIWQPDLTKSFNQSKVQVPHYEVLAKKSNNIWVPYYFYIDHLLYMDSTLECSISSSSIFSLVLINDSYDISESQTERYWMFSALPGINIRIYESDFKNENQLEEFLDQISHQEEDPKGLIVSIKVIPFEGSIKVMLYDGQVQNDNYPELDCPFDRRNISWRNLFVEEINANSHLAYGENSDYHLDLSPDLFHGSSSFPLKVPLDLELLANELEIQVSINENTWDPYTGRVEAQIIKGQKLGKINDSYLPWLAETDLTNQIFTLSDKASIDHKTNYVHCISQNGIAISVPLDSFVVIRDIRSRNLDFLKNTPKVRITRTTNITHTLNNKSSLIPADNLLDTGASIKGLVIELERSSCRVSIGWVKGNQIIEQKYSFGSNKDEDFKRLNIGDIIEYHFNKSWIGIHKSRRYYARALRKVRDVQNEKGSLNVNILGENYQTKESNYYWAESQDHPGELLMIHSDQELNFPDNVSIHNGAVKSIEHNDVEKWSCLTLPQIRKQPLTLQLSLRNRYGKPQKRMYGLVEKNTNYDSSFTQLKSAYYDIDVLGEYVDFQLFLLMDRSIRSIEMAPSFSETDGLKVKFELIHNDPKKCFFGKINKRGDHEIIENLRRRVPLDTDKQKWDNTNTWVNTVEVKRGESSYIPRELNSYDEQDVSFRLTEYKGQFRASFRMVEPILEPNVLLHSHISGTHIKEAYGAGNTNFPTLHFVRFFNENEELPHFPGLKRLPNETYCLFEFGYGKLLYVPAGSIYKRYGYNKKSKIKKLDGNQLKSILFFGDRIEKYKIKYFNKQSLREHGAIYKSYIEFEGDIKVVKSQGRELYEKSRKENHIHIAYFNQGTGEIEKIKSSDKNGKQKEYKRTHARVNEKDIDTIRKLDVQTEVIPLPVVVDTSEFKKSNGSKLIVRVVRYSFNEDNGDIEGLTDSSYMIYVKAGSIYELGRNNHGLGVSPLEIPSKEFIGKDFQRTYIVKRHFSADRGLLQRLYQDGDKDYFQDQVFIAKVQPIVTNNQKRAQITLMDIKGVNVFVHPPVRDEQGLISEVQLSNQVIYVRAVTTVQKWNKQHHTKDSYLYLEYRPGIFFSINRRNWELPKDCSLGNLLRVDITKKKQCLKQSSFGDSRYFSTKYYRPVVVFPKYYLLNNKDLEQKKAAVKAKGILTLARSNKNFTVGSFPFIEVTDDNKTFDYDKIMSQFHPKIAYARKRGTGEYVIVSDYERLREHNEIKEVEVGKLVVEESHVAVKLFRLNDIIPSSWLNLTYQEDKISVLKTSLRRNWSYDEQTTGTYEGIHESNGDKVHIIEQKIKAHDAENGPLFFSKDHNFLSLRHNDLTTTVLPHRELLQFLTYNNKQSLHLTVVDVEMARKEIESHGLLVEFTPGRVLEIPTEMIIEKTGNQEQGLADFAWQLLKCGDKVSLNLDSVSSYVSNKLVLKKWKPSIRNVLTRKTLAQVQAVHKKHEQQDGMTIGNGLFTITLPYEKEVQEGEVVIFNSVQNQIEHVNNQYKPEGECTFWVQGNLDNLKLASALFEDYTIELSPEMGHWKNTLLYHETKKLLSNEQVRKFIEIIHMCGGSLPVKIDKIIPDQKLIYVHYCNTLPSLKMGQFAKAVMIGQFEDKSVLLKIGLGFYQANVSDVFIGLDDSMAPGVIRKMIERKSDFYVHINEERKLVSGIDDHLLNTNSEHEVLPLLTVRNRDEQFGLLFQGTLDKKLYFVKAENASWAPKTDLSVISDVFEKMREMSKIKVERNVCSLTQVKSVMEHYRQLQIGDVLEVKMLQVPKQDELKEKPKQGAIKVPVWHKKTGIYSVCDYYGTIGNEDIHSIQVEIMEKDQDERPVFILRGGEESFELDIPKSSTELEKSKIDIYDNPNKKLMEDQLGQDKKIALLVIKCYKMWIDQNVNIDPPAELIESIEKWLGENRNKEEISLLESLIVFHSLIMLELRNPSTVYQKYVSEMSTDLIKRAVRSFHVEVLSKEKKSATGRLKAFDFTQSLINYDEYVKLKATYEGIILKGEFDHLQFAKAQLASIGQLNSPIKTDNSSELDLQRLIKILGLFQSGLVNDKTCNRASREIDIMIEKIISRGHDIFLLNPLPAD